MVVLSGRVSYKAPDNFYSKLINIAKKMKVPVLVDTSGKPLIEALKAKPLIVKPNIHEAQEIFNCRIKTIKQIKKIVLKLHGFGIKIVLLTIGEKGAILSDGNKILKALAPKIKDINDVGSGDCFIAGFLYSFLKNEPMEKCLKMAVSAGSINALSAMPGSIKFKKVFELSKKIKILNI